jgi:hypothetical protein
MTMTKHTPGPWKMIDSCGEISVAQQDSEMPVCCFSGRGDDDTDTQLIPDAKLISAAPELLAACIRVKERFDNLGMDWLGPDPLEAAINKATGRLTFSEGH